MHPHAQAPEPNDVEELNLFGTSTVSTNRTARACRCMVTGRTTRVTRSPFPPTTTGQCMPETDRSTFLVSMWTKRPSTVRTQPRRVPGGNYHSALPSCRCQKYGRSSSVMICTQRSSRGRVHPRTRTRGGNRAHHARTADELEQPPAAP